MATRNTFSPPSLYEVLSTEIICHLLSFVDLPTLCRSFSLVSKRSTSLARDPVLLRLCLLQNYPGETDGVTKEMIAHKWFIPSLLGHLDLRRVTEQLFLDIGRLKIHYFVDEECARRKWGEALENVQGMVYSAAVGLTQNAPHMRVHCMKMNYATGAYEATLIVPQPPVVVNSQSAKKKPTALCHMRVTSELLDECCFWLADTFARQHIKSESYWKEWLGCGIIKPQILAFSDLIPMLQHFLPRKSLSSGQPDDFAPPSLTMVCRRLSLESVVQFWKQPQRPIQYSSLGISHPYLCCHVEDRFLFCLLAPVGLVDFSAYRSRVEEIDDLFAKHHVKLPPCPGKWHASHMFRIKNYFGPRDTVISSQPFFKLSTGLQKRIDELEQLCNNNNKHTASLRRKLPDNSVSCCAIAKRNK